jgi:replicative DNA helicase
MRPSTRLVTGGSHDQLTAVRTTALKYLEGGWPLVLLYGATADGCSCGRGPTCRNPGKHPIDLGWQNRPIRTAEELELRLAERGPAPTNIGVLLTDELRVLLVDEDNKNGKKGAETIQQWEEELGLSFRNCLLQETPSGGRHYLFRIPETYPADRLPNGSAAPGVDIIRHARQFVVAPSQTPLGCYRALGNATISLPAVDDVPLAPASLLNHLSGLGKGNAHRLCRIDREALRGPDLEIVKKVVRATPNPAAISYSGFIDMAHYIRGACGPENENAARDLFRDWAARWEGGDNPPDYVDEKFDSIGRNVHSGWPQLLRFARENGCSGEVMTEAATAEARRTFSPLPGSEATTDWDKPLPVVEPNTGPPPAFPLRALPPQMQALVQSVAANLEVPEDFAAILLLGAVAGAAQRTYTLRVHADYREPLGLYLIVVAESGERKTPTVRIFRQPYDRAQEILRKRALPAIGKAKARREILEREKQSMFGLSAAVTKKLVALMFPKDQDEELQRDDLLREKERYAERVAQISGQLEALEIPPAPLLWLTEATPEATARHLAELQSLVVFASEGDLIDVAAGQYGDKTGKLGILLSAYSMDTHVESRVDGTRAAVDPRLSIVLAVQPGVVRKLQDVREFRERGLTPRFLYAAPPSRVGYRTWAATDPIDPTARATYERIIAKLLEVDDDLADPVHLPSEDEVPEEADARQPASPLPPQKELVMSPEAIERFRAYGREIERELVDDDSPLCEFVTWGSKLPGQMLRLAGCLHLLAHGELDTPDPSTIPISAETVERAIEIAEYFKAHTLSMFVTRTPAIRREEVALEWIKQNGAPEFRPRDLYRSKRRQFDNDIRALHETLGQLEELGWISGVIRRTGRPGRPPNLYQVNPYLWGPAGGSARGGADN